MLERRIKFLTNPLWIALHNTPHSFVVMDALSLLGHLFLQRRWQRFAVQMLRSGALSSQRLGTF